MVSTQAANPNCALLWNDWITSPWANAQVAEWFGEAPSNRESCALTANPDHCSIFHAEETEYWEDVWYWTTATEECIDGRTDVTCVPYSEWINAWNELRLAIPRSGKFVPGLTRIFPDPVARIFPSSWGDG